MKDPLLRIPTGLSGINFLVVFISSWRCGFRVGSPLPEKMTMSMVEVSIRFSFFSNAFSSWSGFRNEGSSITWL